MPWSKAAAHRAVRTMLGQKLQARYEVQDLPPEMLTLLVKLNEREQEAQTA